VKFLFDVGVGVAAERWLAVQGHDVKAVRDLNPSMPDIDILDLAAAEQRLVVTMDKDFGELVYRSRRAHAGVLLLRLEAATAAEKVAVLEIIVTQHLATIEGNFAVYQNGRLRIRN
jgi:predicted nuclease of predicted toxin-antitoxin system